MATYGTWIFDLRIFDGFRPAFRDWAYVNLDSWRGVAILIDTFLSWNVFLQAISLFGLSCLLVSPMWILSTRDTLAAQGAKR